MNRWSWRSLIPAVGIIMLMLALPAAVLGKETVLEAELISTRATAGGAEEGTLRFSLDQETPDQGGKVCWQLHVAALEGGDRVTAAHVHRADGREAFDFFGDPYEPASDAANCFFFDNAAFVEIFGEPCDYSVDVHTERHPDGAVKGDFCPDGTAPETATDLVTPTDDAPTVPLLLAAVAALATLVARRYLSTRAR